MPEIYPILVSALHNKTISGKAKNKFYRCIHIDEHCIIFSGNEKSGKAMIPTEVAIEWIEAFMDERVYDHFTGKERVKIIGQDSKWSNYCHGFTSHMGAIVRAYFENTPQK